MKILTKEEESAHYNATVKGGALGGVAGLGVGTAAVLLGSRRFHIVNALTLPMKTFLVTSSSTFAAIVSADRASRRFEDARDPQRRYRDHARQRLEEARAQESTMQRSLAYVREHRFGFIVGGWAASMAGSFWAINRSPYLTGAQKLVQARVVAQGVTIALILASAVLEIGDARKGQGRWETVTVLDPDDPEHKRLLEKKVHKESYEGEDLWRDMVDAEERKLQARRAGAKQVEAEDHQHHHNSHSQNKKRTPSHSNTSDSSKPAPRDDPAANGKSRTTNKGQSAHDPRNEGPSPMPAQDKGKANKDRILRDVQKPSAKSDDEIARDEAEKLQAQAEKHADIRSEGVPNGPAGVKVSSRNE